MAKAMKMESMVERPISSWLNELYMSGFERITMLKMLPMSPTVPGSKLGRSKADKTNPPCQ